MIAPLRVDDADRCASIEAQLFDGDAPWSAEAFRSEISAPHNTYFGVTEDDRLVGYAGIAAVGRPGDVECEIHTIAVESAYQGRGLGRDLLLELLAVADRQQAPTFLEVRVDNTTAIELYRRNGFIEIGRRRNYYQQAGVDAVTMRRDRTARSDRTTRREGQLS